MLNSEASAGSVVRDSWLAARAVGWAPARLRSEKYVQKCTCCMCHRTEWNVECATVRACGGGAMATSGMSDGLQGPVGGT